MDYKGLEAVVSGRAARQILTLGMPRDKRYEARGEAIRCAQALGRPYRVTPYAVEIGQQPVKKSKPIPEVVPARKKAPKRATLWARDRFASGRVRRTSTADIEWDVLTNGSDDV